MAVLHSIETLIVAIALVSLGDKNVLSGVRN